ncbi:MAG: hypothetical protein EF813_11350 [Methanosarcinales archaeon]|nr:MAG: hypothetical protein EF813_11350 [Methanosarcinales archaeon]
MRKKQLTATDFLLQRSQKLAIKCGNGGFPDTDQILEILSVLMAPCAVLFLQSVPANQRELVKLPTIVVVIMSACALVGYFFGMTLHNTTMFIFIYPIIGICLLIVATKIDQ